jgi:hypothetical protein
MEKETLKLIQDSYKILASPKNQWENRHTGKGQTLLCDLRNLIAKELGMDEQEVQDGVCEE